MFLLKRLAYFFHVLFRLPYNLGRYGKLAYSAPYHSADKWEIFNVLVSLWVKAFLFKSRKTVVSQSIFGNKVYGYSYTALSVLFEEIFVSNVYSFASEKPDPFIIDGGANIGFATLFFKKLYPQATIFAFEPDPDAFYLLQKNIKENNIPGVTLFNEALSNTNSGLNFYSGPKKGGLTSSLSVLDNTRQTIQVQARNFSDLVKSWPQPDLIKLDVEGAEFDIINGLATNNQLHAAAEYIIEYHHFHTETPGRFSQFTSAFEKENFKLTLINISPIHKKQQDIIFRFHLAKTFNKSQS